MVEHHTNYGDGDDWTVRDVVSVSREILVLSCRPSSLMNEVVNKWCLSFLIHLLPN